MTWVTRCLAEVNPNNLIVPEQYHIPVLLHEVIEGLNIRPGGVYVDCTFGGGGHSKAILQKLSATGKLIAFDQDDDARLAHDQVDEGLGGGGNGKWEVGSGKKVGHVMSLSCEAMSQGRGVSHFPLLTSHF